jgi:capsular exopolysaccharide synthesis family protein
MGLMMSLVGAMGLAWALERFNDSIRSVDDVLRLTQLPALAVIPSIRKIRALPRAEATSIGAGRTPSPEMQRARVMEYDGRSPTSEAYRALRTGLLLSVAGSPPKTILVTSVRTGEGKTTTATNTAIALAQLGGAVLLIDADLRKPSIQSIFAVAYDSGLSTYLTGSLDIGEVAQPLPVENLSVIPAGPPPPNPAELLSSDRMKGLLKQASALYDHVIIDSPPMGSVTDPVVLSTMVDGVILVVQGGKNSRQAVQRGCQEFTAVGAKIFGVVLNNVDLKREGYDDYYYYSSYYGHGDDGDKRRA